MTTVRSPIVICPRITCTPPTISTSAVPIIVTAVTLDENSDCCHVSAIRAFIVRSPAAAYSRRLVGLAREALDQPDRRKRLVQPLDELRLELLHALLAIEQRGDVVADAEIQERHDGQGEQRHRDVELHENREHHDQGHDRRDERKAADEQVLDRVRIDVHTVDRVSRIRLDVMMEPERLQMLKQAVAEAVNHPLAGIDLHLRAVDGHGLARQLKHDAGDHERHEQRERIDHANGLKPSGKRLRNGLPDEDVVDDGLQQPGLQRDERDLDAAAGWPRASCVRGTAA